MWAKSQDSVHKSQFLKRKESRSGSNRGPSAYQPSALPLGHTGSQATVAEATCFIPFGRSGTYTPGMGVSALLQAAFKQSPPAGGGITWPVVRAICLQNNLPYYT